MATWRDWTADAVGSVAAVWLVWLVVRFVVRRGAQARVTPSTEARKS